VSVPHEPTWARSNWQSYCIELPSFCDQRLVMQRMLERGVSTRRGVMNSHLERPYKAASRAALPRSERVQRQGVILPLIPLMTSSHVEEVCDALAAAMSSRS
jgi:dTDP-4-amino-4,6-dideoxygalactose transaminase